MLTSHFCAAEKYAWVRQHFGPEWLNRMILTVDKTTVRGDVLIDDKPKIVGVQHPTWRHLLFNAPYNQTVGLRLEPPTLLQPSSNLPRTFLEESLTAPLLRSLRRWTRTTG